MAGLGAFLLVAAAATFVAVRWDDIPAGLKLAALVAVTLTCLQAHLRLRDPLPVTATVLLHLGVLLVPVDVAALGVRFGWDWPTMLLAQGLAATVVFGAAAWADRSVVLQAGTWLGVVLLAGGIGGLTVAPAGLVLAGTALAAVAARVPVARLAARRRPAAEPAATETAATDVWAAGWALLAGLAMPLAATQALGVQGAGVIEDLGLTGDRGAAAAGLTGVVAGIVLGIVGGRRRSLPAALTGIACVLAGATTAWMDLGPDGSRPEDLDATSALTGLGALALLAELAAWCWRSDPFWHRPTRLVAGLGELGAAAVTLGYLYVGLAGPLPEPSPQGALAAALVSLTWLAVLARQPARAAWTPPPVVPALGPVAAVVAACAAVAMATGSAAATAWALTVGGSAAVLAAPNLARHAHSTSAGLAVGLLTWAPVLARQGDGAADGPLLLVGALGLAGAVATAAGAVVATRAGADADSGLPPGVVPGCLALAPLGMAAAIVATGGEEAAAATLALAGTWLVAAVLDLAVSRRIDAGPGRAGALLAPRGAPFTPSMELAAGDLSTAVRAMALVPLGLSLWLPPGPMAAVAALGAGLAVLDAIRRGQPWYLLGAGLATPIAAAGLALDQGTSRPEAGLVVTLTAVAWLGVAAALPRRWAEPAAVGAGVAATAGFLLCLGDRSTTATYLLVAGGMLAAVGVMLVERAVVGAGAAVATLGLWSHLSLAGVTASEPYVAPAALLALAAGIATRQRAAASAPAVSSWVAYAPSVALLGGSALAERLAGGAAWHALVAGGVGMLAVTAGGLERLAGPLLVGTGLVVAVTVHETLGVTARFPTWIWLGSGGALLLAAGIAMERRATGPVETGKRVVDLLREQFS